jgi:mannose-6-phosphate isomerase-like protein (cupin superfamily)
MFVPVIPKEGDPPSTPSADGTQFFRVRAQMLAQGRTDTILTETDNMQIRIKVYASGGENTLHAHTSEDHSFVVLQGRARFWDKDGNTTDIGQHQGITLPAGAMYKFEATSKEELVLLRMRAKVPGAAGAAPRVGASGKPMHGDSKENKGDIEVIYKDGKFFE